MSRSPSFSVRKSVSAIARQFIDQNLMPGLVSIMM